ncbi:MAG: nitrate transporter [Phycisphaerales bacterium]|nr:nitrate transporter [Phycisphaerales bacterium]
MHTTRPQFRPGSSSAIRIGFVPLNDAAPVIATFELGYFKDEGVEVSLRRELGWANVRDKLAYGRLDAAHALLGLPVASALGGVAAGDPVRSVMALGSGGDAITLSSRLAKAGVSSATALGEFIGQTKASSKGARPLMFGHVFDSSVHHYLLRDWLASGGIDPDKDLRLCVLPPQQMPAHLAAGHLDGFCAGEPWNSVAHADGVGKITALTTDLLPAHPDKVLAVNGRWADGGGAVTSVVRALLRGCRYCAAPTNIDALAEMLSRPEYLDVPAAALAASLRLDRRVGPEKVSHLRPSEWQMRAFDTTFPSHMHAAWLVTQMQRWGHVDRSIDPCAIAARCTDTAPYRTAAASLDMGMPSTDTPPMPLRSGRMFECSPFLEGTLV